MSTSLYPIAGLRFWDEQEIKLREFFTDSLVTSMEEAATCLNQAWVFKRVEAPMLMPLSFFSSSYTEEDVLCTNFKAADEKWTLRAETTNGSYLFAQHLLKEGKAKAPLCVWQAGQSYRTEYSDGATAAKLRFNQFWQLELQFIYKGDSKADYVTYLRGVAAAAVSKLLSKEVRVITSDRLPSYSAETLDIEVLRSTGEWKEVASTSRRLDYPSDTLAVFEVALGLDRLVEIYNEK